MKNTRVSIITAVYNSEQYFRETIESVLKQTYENWEWFIIDDCSTDSTKNIVSEYNDSRIKYVLLENNIGAAGARNKGLELATTDIIAFIDADDTWHENKIERQLKFMLDNKYAFTFTSYQIIGKNKPIKVPMKLGYSSYMKNTIIGMLTVMIDRSKVNNFEIVDIRKDHDSMTWAKILREGTIAYGLDICLAEYRKVEGSISNNKFEAVKNHWNNCRKIEKLSVSKTCYYFVFYGLNAVIKHYL